MYGIICRLKHHTHKLKSVHFILLSVETGRFLLYVIEDEAHA